MMLASLVVTMEADAMRKQPLPNTQIFMYHYVEYDWGDTIHGTKDALRRMGLLQGKAFPAGRRRFVKTTDPRGFPCVITESLNSPFPYMAQIYHPALEVPDIPRAPRIDLELEEEWRQFILTRRPACRLVWSKPEFKPGLNPLPDGPYRSK